GTPPTPMARPLLRRILAAFVVLAAALAAAACSIPTTRTAGAPTTTSDLGAIRVTGRTAAPEVTVPTPFSVPASSRRLLARGTGPVVQAGQRVTVDYLGINGTDGRQILSSYGDK